MTLLHLGEAMPVIFLSGMALFFRWEDRHRFREWWVRWRR